MAGHGADRTSEAAWRGGVRRRRRRHYAAGGAICRLVLVGLVLAGSEATGAEAALPDPVGAPPPPPKPVRMEPAVCRNLVLVHDGTAADFVPGVAADGSPVVPADLTPPPIADPVSGAWLTVTLPADALAGSAADLPDDPLTVGTVTVRNGQVLFDGQPLGRPARAALVEACRAQYGR